MPELGELLVLVVLVLAVAAAVMAPLLSPAADERQAPDALATLELRHRVAIEALRDVEADRRAGSLDDGRYEEQRGAAEARAAQTLVELEEARAQDAPPPAMAAPPDRAARLLAATVGAALAVLLLVGLFVPPPAGLANETRVDQALAAAQAAEEARLQRIHALAERVLADPGDTEALSQLADAYLEGSSLRDLQRGASLLLLLVNQEPDNESAYQRLVTSYLRAGDYINAEAATDAYARLADDSPDIPFFRGLIALRGGGDRAAAAAELSRFLEMAPDDPRATMVRELLRQAAED